MMETIYLHKIMNYHINMKENVLRTIVPWMEHYKLQTNKEIQNTFSSNISIVDKLSMNRLDFYAFIEYSLHMIKNGYFIYDAHWKVIAIW